MDLLREREIEFIEHDIKGDDATLSWLKIVTGKEHVAEPLLNVAVATAVAFVVGMAVIAWFLRYLTTHSLKIFVWYRIGLGCLVLVLLSAGAIS